MLQCQLLQPNGQKAGNITKGKTKTNWVEEWKKCECSKNHCMDNYMSGIFCIHFSIVCCCCFWCKFVFSVKRSTHNKNYIRIVCWRPVFNVKIDRQQNMRTQTSVDSTRAKIRQFHFTRLDYDEKKTSIHQYSIWNTDE